MSRFRRAQWISLIAAGLLLAITFARTDAAVTVSSFAAQAQSTQITISWKTASEINNAGFNLYRSTSSTGPWDSKINTNGIIPAQCPMCAFSNQTYSFGDTTAMPNQKYFYKLEGVELGGSTQQFGPVSAQISASTATPTSPAATATSAATQTPTLGAVSSPTNTSIPGTPTATVYNSPTPLGTPPSTATPFPTHIAYVVGVPTFTPQPANAKSAPPKTSSSNPQPGNAKASASGANASPAPPANPPSSVSVDPGLPNSQDEAIHLADRGSDTPMERALPRPIDLVMFGAAGLLAVAGLVVGAVALYFLTRRFIG